MQLPFFGTLIDWLQTQPELSAVVNTDTIGVAGHSRGAKLAALTLASGKLVQIALIFKCTALHTFLHTAKMSPEMPARQCIP